MVNRVCLLFFLPILCCIPAQMKAGALNGLTDINDACLAFEHERPFCITTCVERITRQDSETTVLNVRTDKAWSLLFLKIGLASDGIMPGDRIRATGYLQSMPQGIVMPVVDDLAVLAHGEPAIPRSVPLREIGDGRHPHATVLVSGLVTDVFEDEIDSRFLWLSLTDGATVIYASLMVPPDGRAKFKALVGAHIVTPAEVMTTSDGLRVKMGQNLSLFAPNQLRILQPPPADPFDAAWRQRRCGRVVACWQHRNALLRIPPESSSLTRFCRVEFADVPLPPCGSFIEAAGIPMTDFYSDNLTRAIWRPAKACDTEDTPPLDIDPQTILEVGTGQAYTGINPRFHGQLIRMNGQVLDKPGRDGRFNLNCSGRTISVDLSSVPEYPDELQPGCRINITGICVMDVPNWLPGGPFPRITGFTLVVRTAEDIFLLEQAPWWTPARFAGVILIFAAIIALFCFWNTALRILVARRSRQLVREQAQKIEAELQISERTRLAAELHDSVAQNLSSVAMQLDAASLAAQGFPTSFRSTLELASKTLLSCRQELRNCLWDLRNRALDEPDLGMAISETLRPHIGNARLRIRFNVPRRLISDNTAHAILRILRELTSNAIHHGQAGTLTIAGCLDNRKILFSLADDGVGFDPSAVGSIEDGHFGLCGIRDRVSKLNGTFSLDSSPGRGTKAVVTINS